MLFKLRKVRQTLVCLTIALTSLHVRGRIFDSPVVYRQGENKINVDTATLEFEIEVPDAPASAEDVFTYTQASTTDDTIDVVHAYSMRNGLYGKPEEARVFWTKLDFSNPDYHRSGHA